ncbi:MAG: SH3 domain-containing protein [Microcystis sp.]
MMKSISFQLVFLAVLVFTGCFISLLGSDSSAQTQSSPCQIRAYVIDQDSRGLNVRSNPNSRSRILGVLPANTDVRVFTYRGNWMLISPIDPKSQGIQFQGRGWVYMPLLGTGTRGYGKDSVVVFANANYQSKVVGRIPSSRPVQLLGCRGEWAFVQKEGVKGWLPPEDQCAAALTTCP